MYTPLKVEIQEDREENNEYFKVQGKSFAET